MIKILTYWISIIWLRLFVGILIIWMTLTLTLSGSTQGSIWMSGFSREVSSVGNDLHMNKSRITCKSVAVCEFAFKSFIASSQLSPFQKCKYFYYSKESKKQRHRKPSTTKQTTIIIRQKSKTIHKRLTANLYKISSIKPLEYFTNKTKKWDRGWRERGGRKEL